MLSKNDILIEKTTALTKEEKKLFAYFGENAKIRPPFRILNPQNIHIGDYVSIRENAYIHAYQDLSGLYDYIEEKFKKDFNINDYKYNSKIIIGNEVHIARHIFISCTRRIEIKNNVTIAERVFIGDNNHSFSHPFVPIMQQPNKQGRPIFIDQGSWIGVGAAILGETRLGRNNVVASNSVVKGQFPDHAVIGHDYAKLLFTKKYDFTQKKKNN